MIGQFIGLIAMMMGLSIPIIAIMTGHHRHLVEMKLRLQGQGSENVRADIEALRQEVRALRDTTMQYDLSFDAALGRMESRVGNIERTGATVVSESTAVGAAAANNGPSSAQNSYAPMAASSLTYNEEPLTLRAGN